MESGRISVRIIAFAAFSAICYFGATAIITVVLAILVAYLLDPLVEVFLWIRVPRGLAIGLSMIIGGFVIAALITLFVDRTQEFSDNLPQYKTKIQKVSNDIRQRVRTIQKKSEDISKTILPKQPKQPVPLQVEQQSTLREFFFRDLGPFYEYMVLISFFPFLVYFLLLEKTQLRIFIISLVRSRTNLSNTLAEGASDRIIDDFSSKIRGFVLGYLISTAILFVAALVLFASFGVEDTFIWAVIFALLNVLPFVGAILGMLPPILISMLQFNSIETGILLVSICLGIHLVYANWLIPRTTSARTELSPLVVLLAMMYWGFLWGAIGIFLAIPLTASLRTLWIQYRRLQVVEEERLPSPQAAAMVADTDHPGPEEDLP